MPSTEPIHIDFVDSYARLRGDDVEIVLATGEVSASNESTLVLSQGDVAVKASTSAATSGDAPLLVASTARAGLSDGTWSIALGSGQPFDARLLVQGRRPVVLVLGAQPMPSRAPARRRRAAGTAPAPLSTKQKVASAGGKVLDRALGVLPADRAARARQRARSMARSVLH
ncbi:MAG: hypothetical protein JOZ82_00685 [Marmoricola sp.]|nr:hypothetical protein [Marmoricola sp.]